LIAILLLRRECGGVDGMRFRMNDEEIEFWNKTGGD
jgi:hypothetical protein